MIDLGGCSLRTAPLEESTVFSSMGTPGRDFGSEPVARIADVAWIVSVPPGPDTSTAPRVTGSPRTGAPAATPTCCGFALPSQARLARGRLRQPRRAAASHSLHRLASHGGACGNPDVLRLRTPFTGSPRTGAPAATPTCCGFALPSQARLARGRLRQPRRAAASHSLHSLASHGGARANPERLRRRTPG